MPDWKTRLVIIFQLALFGAVSHLVHGKIVDQEETNASPFRRAICLAQGCVVVLVSTEHAQN